jgi:hypothetical protein
MVSPSKATNDEGQNMTRKALNMIALAVMVLVGTVLLITPHADAAAPRSPKCITKAEWRKIKPNMTRAKIKRITGFNGKMNQSSTTEKADGGTDMIVDYRQCTSRGKPSRDKCDTVYVAFSNYTYRDVYDADGYWDGEKTVFHRFRSDYKGDWFPIDYNIFGCYLD